MRDQIIHELSLKADLPPLPDILIRLDQLINDPNVSINAIADLLSTEPALSGKVIQLANSAYYGGGRIDVENLRGAVLRLGLAEIRKMVYAIKLGSMFWDQGIVDQRKFWRHNLGVALLTQKLAARGNAQIADREAAYVAGLMHDVGIMVFGYIIPEVYSAFLAKAAEIDKPLHVQEKETFGIDHSELGALYIQRWWKIEQAVELAVAQHHFPIHRDDEFRLIGQLVNVANAICNNQGYENGIQVFPQMFSDTAWEQIGLNISEAKAIFQDVKDAIAQSEELLAPMA